jgi:hypothetical protein
MKKIKKRLLLFFLRVLAFVSGNVKFGYGTRSFAIKIAKQCA